MSQSRPRSPQPSSRATSAGDASFEADLRVMARLEGRPLPTTMDVAQLFGISPTSAFRILMRLKRNGMLKLVDRVRLTENACHAIVDLRTRLLDVGDLLRLETRLASDAHVCLAAAVSGRHSYRITLIHENAAEANAWFKAILQEPAVIDGVLRYCRPILERHHYARAVVGGDAG